MFKFLNKRKEGIVVLSGAVATIYGIKVILNDQLVGVDKAKVQKGETSETANIKSDNKEQKCILITGANSGIGKALTTNFAENGDKVYMLCRNMDTCEEARQEIVKSTGNK